MLVKSSFNSTRLNVWHINIPLFVCIIIYVISCSTSQHLQYLNRSSSSLQCTECDLSASLYLSQYEVFGLDFLLLWNFLFLFLTTYSFWRRLSVRFLSWGFSDCVSSCSRVRIRCWCAPLNPSHIVGCDILLLLTGQKSPQCFLLSNCF